MTIIADAGPLAALFNPENQWHSWAMRTSRKFLTSPITCDAVITEAFFILRRTPMGPQKLAEVLATPGLYNLPWSFEKHRAAVMNLYLKYNDVPASFADMCILHMASTVKDPLIWTNDAHFKIYRLPRNKPVPIVTLE